MNGQQELDRFVESLGANKKSKKTLKTYEWVIRSMLQTIDKNPTEITLDDIESYKRTLISFKTEGIRTRLVIIKIFLKWLGKEDLAKKITRPRAEKAIPVYLTDEESYRLLQAAKDDITAQAILTTFLYEGLRFGELVNLDINDIDLQEKSIRVRHGKGAKDRILPLRPEVEQVIVRYLQYRTENNICARDGSGTLFLSHPYRRRPSYFYIWNLIKNTAVRAGITKNITAHKLRHSALTHLYRKTRDIRLVQMVAGHSQISTTEIYIHTNFDDIQDAFQKADLTFAKPTIDTIKPKLTINLKEKDVAYG